jgi:hypothetical protein
MIWILRFRAGRLVTENSEEPGSETHPSLLLIGGRRAIDAPALQRGALPEIEFRHSLVVIP